MAVSAADQSASDLELLDGGQQFDPEMDGRWAKGALHVLQQQADVVPPAGHLTGHRGLTITRSHGKLRVTTAEVSSQGQGHKTSSEWHRVRSQGLTITRSHGKLRVTTAEAT